MGKRGRKKTHVRMNITIPIPLAKEMRSYKAKHGTPMSEQLAFARKHFKFVIKRFRENGL